MKITNLTQLVFAFGLEMLSKLKYKKAVIEITNIPAEEKTVKENRKVIIDNLIKTWRMETGLMLVILQRYCGI